MTGQIFGVDYTDIVSGDANDFEFEEVFCEPEAGKHDCTTYWSVYKHITTDTYHAFQYDCSYNDGLQEDSICYCGQVEPFEVVTTHYRGLKND